MRSMGLFRQSPSIPQLKEPAQLLCHSVRSQRLRCQCTLLPSFPQPPVLPSSLCLPRQLSALALHAIIDSHPCCGLQRPVPVDIYLENQAVRSSYISLAVRKVAKSAERTSTGVRPAPPVDKEIFDPLCLSPATVTVRERHPRGVQSATAVLPPSTLNMPRHRMMSYFLTSDACKYTVYSRVCIRVQSSRFQCCELVRFLIERSLPVHDDPLARPAARRRNGTWPARHKPLPNLLTRARARHLLTPLLPSRAPTAPRHPASRAACGH